MEGFVKGRGPDRFFRREIGFFRMGGCFFSDDMIYFILEYYSIRPFLRIFYTDQRMPPMKKTKNREAMFSARRQILNIGFVVLILVVTFVFLFRSLSGFNDDPGSYREFFRTTRWWILPLGCVFLVLSVLCEARNLGMILKLIGHRKSLKSCTVYASSDLYFSAITPSATGGQPAAAYYMTKDGVPLSQSSAILVLNVSTHVPKNPKSVRMPACHSLLKTTILNWATYSKNVLPAHSPSTPHPSGH